MRKVEISNPLSSVKFVIAETLEHGIIMFISYLQNIIIVSEYIQSQESKKGVY